MPISTQNIESELSYAYLHAIASRAGMNCKIGNRHDDNEGIDAVVNYLGPIPGTYLTDVQIDIQLKATTQERSNWPNHFPYFIQKIERYDWLRTDNSTRTKILVVLFLPKNADTWLNCTSDQLILKEAAYWVCLYGADASSNSTGQTVYLPKSNLLDPERLKNLATRIGQKNIPLYQMP